MPVSPEELRIGTKADDFNLKGVDGNYYSLDSFKDKKVLCIIFWCNHCPYVIAVQDRINQIAKDYADKSFALTAINPNDPESYPEDSYENMQIRANERGYVFPYLRDETQEIARAYDAVCTPDIYLYDENRILRYRGRLDDSWKDETKVTRNELRMAIEALLNEKPIDFDTIPPMGCSIKWK
ncbi:MAG: thioredoxin family protein [Ignavibacteriae bacterium]|nr:MAG: thioredoxin family protein [Ignavibacteriota bacterium]